MLNTLRSLFVDHFPPTRALPDVGHDEVAIAAACLMITVARQDDGYEADERGRITHLIGQHFGLQPWSAQSLVARAEAVVDESVAEQPFTLIVKEHMGHDERIELIEMLWRVAYADGDLHDNESNLMRRVTALLYVTDRESGDARKRVLASLQG
ncbi:TerB family tellurite resistance protein [Marinivivus vitaminiproducens]|uniref:tellurite resistance TerB family protein n=1 Tax=Marinivivus vitaminiproducens TaxID=3035935 RepID=UPI00279A282C|nr:TerB family tellurite resistance protein [Geminicoccaceae bacterium SCSIO 64248]